MKKSMSGLVTLAAIALLFLLFGPFYTIAPGTRGVKVTLGKMEDQVLTPGLGMKMPMITSIWKISVQQDSREMKAECYSSDLQQVTMQLKVLWRIPEASTVTILRDYAGEPFDKLVQPRVQEAMKEVTALKTAAEIVKTREQIKMAALDSCRKKIGNILIVQDVVIENVDLSADLEKAIEAKMVQQQEAEKALFRKQQAATDAETVIIAAKGQAEAMSIQGAALEKNQNLVQWEMAKKWNGVLPAYMGGGVQALLPIK